jgi:hypothetical protein
VVLLLGGGAGCWCGWGGRGGFREGLLVRGPEPLPREQPSEGQKLACVLQGAAGGQD